MKKLLIITFSLTLCFFFGCVSKSSSNKNDGGDTTSPTASLSTQSITVDDTGTAQATFAIPVGTNKFNISVEADGKSIRFDSVLDDQGQQHIPAGEFVAGSQDLESNVASITIPPRDFDLPVSSSQTYLVSAKVSSDVSGNRFIPARGATVKFTIGTKVDPNLSSGTLQMNVFFVGNVNNNPHLSESITQILQIVADTYESQAKLDINASIVATAGPDALPLPSPGSAFYRSAASGSPSPAINIFIGEDIDSSGFGQALLGFSGGIPGPPFASQRGAVAVSFLEHAGLDGQLSEDEIRLFGETIAHESGHFLGLFHPMELTTGGLFNEPDPLTDTPTCTTLQECISNGLAANLMFPTPVTNINQNRLSQQQARVMNLQFETE